MQVRQDIEILGPDKPEHSDDGFDDEIVITSNNETLIDKPSRLIGWTIRETIGLAIVNPRGIAKANKTTIIGS